MMDRVIGPLERPFSDRVSLSASSRQCGSGWPSWPLGAHSSLDYFSSQRCGTVIGDLTAEFRPQPPGPAHVELATFEGVQVFAEKRLLPVLEDAALTLRLAGPAFARHLAISLDSASRWIEFLEQPAILAGKLPLRPKR